MLRNLIVAVFIVLVVTGIALQNTQHILIKLFFWSFKSPVSLLLTSSLFIGGLFGVVFSFPVIKKKNDTIENLKRKMKAKEDKGNNP
jgi:uncharacterized integral membrane protein